MHCRRTFHKKEGLAVDEDEDLFRSRSSFHDGELMNDDIETAALLTP